MGLWNKIFKPRTTPGAPVPVLSLAKEHMTPGDFSRLEQAVGGFDELKPSEEKKAETSPACSGVCYLHAPLSLPISVHFKCDLEEDHNGDHRRFFDDGRLWVEWSD